MIAAFLLGAGYGLAAAIVLLFIIWIVFTLIEYKGGN